MRTASEALNFLLDRGYTIDLPAGELVSPHPDGLWADEEEEEAVRRLCTLD